MIFYFARIYNEFEQRFRWIWRKFKNDKWILQQEFFCENFQKNKFFDEFLIKFSTTIIDLRFNNEMKIYIFVVLWMINSITTRNIWLNAKNLKFFAMKFVKFQNLIKIWTIKKTNSTSINIILIISRIAKFFQRTKSFTTNRVNKSIEYFSSHV